MLWILALGYQEEGGVWELVYIYLNFFHKKYTATYNITKVCILVIIICHLTSFGTKAWLILSTYFKKKGLELDKEGAGMYVAREKLLSVIKFIYWWSTVMTV